MGIISRVSSVIDEEDDVLVVYVRMSGVFKKTALRRVAARAAIEAGISPNLLVAATDEFNWREGPFSIRGRDQFPDAEDIEYSEEYVRFYSEGEFQYLHDQLHTWRIPLTVAKNTAGTTRIPVDFDYGEEIVQEIRDRLD